MLYSNRLKEVVARVLTSDLVPIGWINDLPCILYSNTEARKSCSFKNLRSASDPCIPQALSGVLAVANRREGDEDCRRGTQGEIGGPPDIEESVKVPRDEHSLTSGIGVRDVGFRSRRGGTSGGRIGLSGPTSPAVPSKEHRSSPSFHIHQSLASTQSAPAQCSVIPCGAGHRCWSEGNFRHFGTAISVPRECEQNPEIADAVNVPRSLLLWLKSFAHNKPLFIHLSTDQVYEGTKAFYKEEDEAKPVNLYGKTKLDAENLIRADWPNYAILRSSIIYGPQPAVPVAKTLPVQWIDSTLAAGAKTDFFADEFRSPVYVVDVVKVVVLLMLRLLTEGGFAQILLNVGGPDRLSRAGMAEVVAQVRGYDLSLVNHVPASTVNRGVKSPPDISMNISKMRSLLAINPTKFADGVRETCEASETPDLRRGAAEKAKSIADDLLKK